MFSWNTSLCTWKRRTLKQALLQMWSSSHISGWSWKLDSVYAGFWGWLPSKYNNHQHSKHSTYFPVISQISTMLSSTPPPVVSMVRNWWACIWHRDYQSAQLMPVNSHFPLHRSLWACEAKLEGNLILVTKQCWIFLELFLASWRYFAAADQGVHLITKQCKNSVRCAHGYVKILLTDW